MYKVRASTAGLEFFWKKIPDLGKRNLYNDMGEPFVQHPNFFPEKFPDSENGRTSAMGVPTRFRFLPWGVGLGWVRGFADSECIGTHMA